MSLNGKTIRQALSEAEGRLVFAVIVTLCLFISVNLGTITGEQLLIGLIGESGILAILAKRE